MAQGAVLRLPLSGFNGEYGQHWASHGGVGKRRVIMNT
tara:strand:+ start:1621 stop:1734 length:114 start_codon:yes stop_codon:yes gene_type:complete